MKVIFKPENDFPASNHLLMYQRPVVRAGLKKKAGGEAEELQGTWLRPGVNELSPEEWKFILEHPDTEERLRRGVFKEVKPAIASDATPTGTLADYALPEARDIIFNTHDPEWLQRVRTVDNRPEIERYCAERLKVMEQKTNLNATPNYGQR